MEKSGEIKQVMSKEGQLEILLLATAAEIFPLLEAEGLGLSKGVVMHIENRQECERFVYLLKNLHIAVRTTICCKKKENCYLRVYECGKYDKGEKLHSFLVTDDDIPIILTHGLVPEKLQDSENIIFLRRINLEGIDDLNYLLEDCKRFVHQNPNLIQRELKFFKKSKFFEGQMERNPLRVFLETSVRVLCLYLRELGEYEAMIEIIYKYLQNILDNNEKMMDNLLEEYEIEDLIRKSFLQFFSKHEEIILGNVDEVEKELWEAVKKENAVLYDRQWFYIPEKLLKASCEEFLDSISFLQIKHDLRERKILMCNETGNMNYTIKKMFTNSFGYSCRVRFLKMRRDFFEKSNSLGIGK